MTPAALRVKVDDGWLTIPGAFLELLRGADHVCISNFIVNHERCLVLYAPDEWQTYDAKLAARTDWETRLFRTFLIACGADLEIDRRGRVQIPEHLQSFVAQRPPFAMLPPAEPREVLLCRPDPRWML